MGSNKKDELTFEMLDKFVPGDDEKRNHSTLRRVQQGLVSFLRCLL